LGAKGGGDFGNPASPLNFLEKNKVSTVFWASGQGVGGPPGGLGEGDQGQKGGPGGGIGGPGGGLRKKKKGMKKRWAGGGGY